MKSITKTFAVMASLTSLCGAANAEGFRPDDNCFEALIAASDADKSMIAAWGFGFLAAKQGDARPVDAQNNKTLLGNLIKACARDPSRSLIELLDSSRQKTAEVPGSEAHARVMLMRFFEPNADLGALTAALKPSEADIRKVYHDPLAEKLVVNYGELFAAGTKFGPKPAQDTLLTVAATTGGLRSGNAVLREFPGGYAGILDYFKGDYPILRFKFVKSGETSGLAFDGLIYVNNHWVLMPKPWRYLD